MVESAIGGYVVSLWDWIRQKWAGRFGSRDKYGVCRHGWTSRYYPCKTTAATSVASFPMGGKKGLGTSDDVYLLLQDLAIRVKREILLDVPFEVTVVVPRAEITKKYRDGELVETNLVYSSITISHSPRYPERGR